MPPPSSSWPPGSSHTAVSHTARQRGGHENRAQGLTCLFFVLNLNLSFLAWFLFVTHLGDANSIHPLVQGPDVVAAQILDVL